MRRVYRRPYFFEWLAIANLALVAVTMFRSEFLVRPILANVFNFTFGMIVQGAVGVIIRSIVARARGERGYFRIIRSAEWLTDTLRILVFGSFAVFTYAWIKLVVPLYHRALFDQLGSHRVELLGTVERDLADAGARI